MSRYKVARENHQHLPSGLNAGRFATVASAPRATTIKVSAWSKSETTSSLPNESPFFRFHYFSPPQKPPRYPFLSHPESETLGDICFFLNMIMFQIAWNLLSFSGIGRPSGPAEFCGRLFILCFIALLIYFPPRMFYLAEDIDRPRTWLTMLLANSPVIIRTLIGTKEWS